MVTCVQIEKIQNPDMMAQHLAFDLIKVFEINFNEVRSFLKKPFEPLCDKLK